jgi:photosynthetic reaction center H subunit
MQIGALTGYIDVAQIVLYAFWLFFAGLIYYLLRENKREGYPMYGDHPGERPEGWPGVPTPKTFILADGNTRIVPRAEPVEQVNAVPTAKWEGSARQPTGNPMLGGIGPGSYAQNRPDEPDHTFDDALPKIVPLRTVPEFWVANEDPNPFGMQVFGADWVYAGRVVDSWVDRSEVVIRYFEIELEGSGGRVMLPQHYANINKKTRQIKVGAILGAQFKDVPRLQNAETITLLEEEKLVGYYAGGLMYATPTRLGPVL